MDNTFKDNPNLQEYYQTSDGQKFPNENIAKSHATTLINKAVKKITRPAEIKTKETAAEIIALSKDMDLDTAQDYLDAENALGEKARKSVIEALETRISEL